MFVLRLVGKILLVPVWLLLAACWLPVHLLVCICGLCHGIGKLFFGALVILAALLGMWQNVIIFSVFIGCTFLVVFAGAFLEMLVEEARRGVGSLILAG